MWRILALWLGPTLGVFIEVGNKNFSGDDQGVASALRKRMDGVRLPPPPADHIQDAFMFAMDMHEMQEEQELRDARRAHNSKYPATPLPFDTRLKTVEMMRHHIYATQYRLKDQSIITEKYSEQISFRMSYIFCRLDTLVEDLLIILSRANRTQNIYNERGRKNQNRQSFFVQLVYYTYILKKNIDITYIIEYLFRLHDKKVKVDGDNFGPGEKEQAIQIMSELGLESISGATGLFSDLPPGFSITEITPEGDIGWPEEKQ